MQRIYFGFILAFVLFMMGCGAQAANAPPAQPGAPECKMGLSGQQTCGYNCKLGSGGSWFCTSKPDEQPIPMAKEHLGPVAAVFRRATLKRDVPVRAGW